MSFTPSKTILISFNQIISTSYNLSGNPINTTHSHKDLGVIVSDNLNWNLVRHIGPCVLYEDLLILLTRKYSCSFKMLNLVYKLPCVLC